MAWYECLDCGQEYMNKRPCPTCKSSLREKIPTPVGSRGRRRNRIGI